jgi:thiamine biosynthesis lipoprotein
MNLKRRIVIFILFIITPLLCLWILQKKVVTISGQTMGTTYSLKCYVPKWVSKSKLNSTIDAELLRINSIFSTWDKSSEISIFNDFNSLDSFSVSPDFISLMQFSYDLYDRTTGYFDPTVKTFSDIWGFSSYSSSFNVPDSYIIKELSNNVGLDKIIVEQSHLKKINPDVTLDLSAIVKGYAVDQISLLLESFGSNRYMVEIGGELRVHSGSSNKPWKIGIRKPKYHDINLNLFGSVDLYSGALATSGDYQNFFEKDGAIYSHIINSKDGSPVSSTITSVSVYAPTCVLADGLATSVVALGVNRGLSLIESYSNVEALILVREADELKLYESSGFSSLAFNKIADN